MWTVRGKSFVKAGKLKKIALDDFASISASFSKKDLSTIVGKTITAKRDKSIFVGLLKGDKSVRALKVTSTGKAQLGKALDKVVTTAAAAAAANYPTDAASTEAVLALPGPVRNAPYTTVT